MSEPTVAELNARVQSLRAAVYSQPDPTADEQLFKDLLDAEKQRDKAQTPNAATPLPVGEAKTPPPPTRRPSLLGPDTTALHVETKLHMQPLPTGIYHLLDPAKDPLLTVTVTNLALEARRVRVT